MFCKNCGAPMNNNQAICLNCGIEKGKGANFCSNCGAPIPPNAPICMNCGVSAKQYLDGKDKTAMALICFFLGGIGIHNFMMGENKKGIFKIATAIITCGFVSGIIALIDFIKILVDTYEVDPNKLI